MIYKRTKAICGYNCTRRASWRAINNGHEHLACGDHKHRLEGMDDPKEERPDPYQTEADYEIQRRFGV
jgi:hypothetical protein